MVVVLKVWKPKTIMRLEGDQPITAAAKTHSGGEIFMAWLPYLLLVVFVLAWGEPSIKAAIDTLDQRPDAVVPAQERRLC